MSDDNKNDLSNEDLIRKLAAGEDITPSEIPEGEIGAESREKPGEHSELAEDMAFREVEQEATETPAQIPEYKAKELFDSLPGEYEVAPDGHGSKTPPKEDPEHPHNENQEIVVAKDKHPAEVPTNEDPYNITITKVKTKKRKERETSLLSLMLAIVVIAIFLWGGTFLYNYMGLYIVSPQGIHWHNDLIINIKGQRIIIPPSVGIKDRVSDASPIHTHEDDNIIHWHNEAPVRGRDLRIGQFFKVWDRKFDKDHIFEYERGKDGIIYMIVNGELNHQYDRYEVSDGDVIEIILE